MLEMSSSQRPGGGAAGWQCSEGCCPAQVLKKGLTAPSYKYDSGLRDQNAITYVLKQAWEEHQPHVLLVNKQYCLNCYWRDLLREGDLRSDDTKVRACPRGTCRHARPAGLCQAGLHVLWPHLATHTDTVHGNAFHLLGADRTWQCLEGSTAVSRAAEFRSAALSQSFIIT